LALDSTDKRTVTQKATIQERALPQAHLAALLHPGGIATPRRIDLDCIARFLTHQCAMKARRGQPGWHSSDPDMRPIA